MARRRPQPTQEEVGNAVFMASFYSNQELAFLIDHFGEPSEIAVPEGEDLPEGVNTTAIIPILDRTYRLHLLELALLEKSDATQAPFWCGFEALKDVCRKTLEWNGAVAELKRRTSGSDAAIRRAAGAPSLHMWDPDTDVPYVGGVGSDADHVRTALGENGERIPLFIALRETGVGAIKDLSGVAKFLKKGKGPKQVGHANLPTALEYDRGDTTSVVKCPICGHTEVYETTKPSTKLQAERRMHKHLDSTKVKKDQHHFLSQRLKSGRVGTVKPKPEPVDKVADGDDEAGEE